MRLRQPSVQAVLWDLDGVLLDSASYHFQAYRKILAEFGLRLQERYFRSQLFGLRNEEILGRLLGDRLSRSELAALARRKEEVYRSLARDGLQALPGARPLAQAVQAAGIPQAVVSSTPRENILLALSSLDMADLFHSLVSGEDVIKGKPDPEAFLRGAERLHAQPSGCVVIEDAPEGILAGKAAGMRCIGVATTRPEQALIDADLIVPSLEDPRVRQFLELPA